MNETELYHYGVKGMKWGVRRKQLRQTYRAATNKAFARYERDIAAIEKPYKRGQNLSDRDMQRQAAAEKRYSEAVAKAKADYKTGKKALKAEKKKFKSDLKDLRAGRIMEYTETDVGRDRITTKKTYYDRHGKRLSKDYADKLIAASDARTMRQIVGSAVVGTGIIAVQGLLAGRKW